jgi:hypothetical protein
MGDSSLTEWYLRGGAEGETAELEPVRLRRERQPWTVRRAVLWATLVIELFVIAGMAAVIVLFGAYLLRGGR